MTSKSSPALPVLLGAGAGLTAVESPEDIEMDPSVLTFARPGNSTESLPATASPHVDQAIPEIAAMTSGMSPNMRPSHVRASTIHTVLNSPRVEREERTVLPRDEGIKERDFVEEEGRGRSPEKAATSQPASPTKADAPTSSKDASTPSKETSAPAKTPSKDTPTPSKDTPSPPKNTPRRPRADSRASVATFHSGGAESIFRLLPREARSAITRMMYVEPAARCTLTDLLKGKGRSNDLLCGCHSHDPGSRCADHEDEADGEDEGDAWLRGIETCSANRPPGHAHIKVAVDEKGPKKRFF